MAGRPFFLAKQATYGKTPRMSLMPESLWIDASLNRLSKDFHGSEDGQQIDFTDKVVMPTHTVLKRVYFTCLKCKSLGLARRFHC